MARFLLYVALHGEGESSAEFDTVDEVVDAVAELTRKTFESGRNMVTFSVGDMEGTVHEDDLSNEERAIASEKENTDGQG